MRLLLDKGYRVRACVRNADDGARTGFLKAMPGYASGRLTLHGADLDQPGCFDEMFKGCHGVAHVSPRQPLQRSGLHRSAPATTSSSSVERLGQRRRGWWSPRRVAAVISEVDLQEVVRRPVFYEDR